MNKSLFKNLRLQTYLQIINAIIPIITTPYVARVLGAEMIGVYSYATSLASFFTLFELLGIYSYGTRCIAEEKTEENKKRRFLEIYLLQIIASSIATACYVVYCVFIADDKLMAYLQLITLIGYFFDISWLYFGIEDFKTTVTYNLIFRILSVVLLLCFVKQTDDLWLYTIIMLGAPSCSHIALWIKAYIKGYYKCERIKLYDIKKHVVPNLKLFIPLIAMTIYNSTDKTMLGIFSTFEEAGYYYNIDRIINVPFSIFTGISTVVLPHMTSLVVGSKENAKKFFFDTLSGICMLGVAIGFGIIATADVFIPLFLGKGYERCILLIKIFAPIVIVKSLSNAIRMNYLVPFKKENIYINSTIVGAIVNLVLNFILIPQLGALGAEITTIVSECIALIILIVFSYRVDELRTIAKDLVAYICIGGVMILSISWFELFLTNDLLVLALKIVVGAVVFISLTLFYWVLSHNMFYETYLRRYIKRFVHFK